MIGIKRAFASMKQNAVSVSLAGIKAIIFLYAETGHKQDSGIEQTGISLE